MNIETGADMEAIAKGEQDNKRKELYAQAEAAIQKHQSKPEVKELEELLSAAKGLEQETGPVHTHTEKIEGGLYDINDICAAIKNKVEELEKSSK